MTRRIQLRLYGLALLGCMGILLVRIAFTRSLVAGDSVHYFLVARSLALFHKLDLEAGMEHFYHERSPFSGHRKLLELPEPEPATGRIASPKPLGASLFFAPFLVIAHGIWGGQGYGITHQLVCALVSLVSGFGGVLLLLATGKRYFSTSIATLGSLTLWLATPLVYYMTIEPLMSHAVSFFLSSLFLWIFFRASDDPRAHLWAALGTVFALMSLTRYQSAVFAIILIPKFFSQRGHYRFLAFLLGAFPWVVLQGWENQYFFGSPFLTKYAEQFRFAPHWRSALYHLFDPHAGLLTLTPVVAFALYGLKPLAREKRDLALITASAFFAQWILLASLQPHDLVGASFGNRLFIDCLPFLSLGLMAFLETLAQRNFSLALTFSTLVITLNGILAGLYCTRILHDPYLLTGL